MKVNNKMKLKSNLIGTKDFYRRVFAIVVPMIIQNTITNVVSLLDNVMVGRVGTLQMSAVTIVNQLMFIFYLCIFGGVRLIKGTKDDQISLWKKFWVNFAALWVIWFIICIVEALIFGHYLAGIYSYLICYISLIIVIETGVTNKIILRRQNKQNQEKNVTSAPSPKQTDSDSSTQTIEDPQLPPIPEKEDDSK
jgi:hypothetical protein